MAKPDIKKEALKKHLLFKYGSLIEASRQLNISYDRLMNIISGRVQAKLDEKNHISEAVNVGADELFLGEV